MGKIIMAGEVKINLGNFRKRPPMMFEGEWRALKIMKILKKENIWKVYYKEFIMIPFEVAVKFGGNGYYSMEKRHTQQTGFIQISWHKRSTQK
jgi:hypothetical protein